MMLLLESDTEQLPFEVSFSFLSYILDNFLEFNYVH